MDSTGEILRRARTQRGYTLDEVATRTRINRKYLSAIEEGDRGAIPGGFFYKSFARQYAAALSTDDANVLEDVEHSLAAEEPPAPPPPDEEVLKALATRAEQESASSALSAPRSATAYAILLVLAIAGTSGLYMLWHRAQQAQAAGEATRQVPVAKKQDVRPPQPAPAQPAPVKPAAPEQPQTQAAAPPPPPTDASTTPQQPANPAPSNPTPPPDSTAANPESSTAAPPNPAVPGPDDKIALSVSVREPTWFSVSADGKTLYSGTLQPGESRSFAAKDNARMRIGNAGGIDVVFNGKSMGALGESKQVLTVLFTPENFQIVRPEAPPPPPNP